MSKSFEHRLIKVSSYLFFVVIASNLLLLNFWIYKYNLKSRILQGSILDKMIPSDPINTNQIIKKEDCLEDCLAKIDEKVYEATSSLRLASSGSVATSNNQSSLGKEFFIPFGAGSNATDDWIDLPGVQASIDSTQYGQIKSVVFESTVEIPTGNETAYVRLFNVTDKHPVWFSDVSIEGGKAQIVVSKPITLDAGNKVYRVQMKTSLKFPANLVQARLHIATY